MFWWRSPTSASASRLTRKISSGRRGRPRLPLEIFRVNRLAEADVGLRHQNIHRLQLYNWLGRGRCVVRPTRQIRGNAAGTESEDQDANTCGIHTLYYLLLRRDP